MSVQKYSYLKAWLGLGLDNVQTVISRIKRNECVPGKEYKWDIRVTDAPPLTTQPPWRWIIPVIFIHGECGRLKCFLCSCRKSQKVTMDIFEPGDENNEASHRAINSATRNQADPLHSRAGNEDFKITSRAISLLKVPTGAFTMKTLYAKQGPKHGSACKIGTPALTSYQ